MTGHPARAGAFDRSPDVTAVWSVVIMSSERGGQELPGVPEGAWDLRRRSLEVARESILALEGSSTGGGDSRNRAVSVSRWQKVVDRSGEDAAGGSQYWVNRVTEEVRSERPTLEEEAADVNRRAQEVKRLRLTTSGLVTVANGDSLPEDDQMSPAVQMEEPQQTGFESSSPRVSRGGAMDGLGLLAGVVMAKKRAAKKRNIVASKFKVKNGRMGRTSSIEEDLSTKHEADNSLRSSSDLAGLFAGSGDVCMEMERGIYGQLVFDTGRHVVDTSAQSLPEARQAKFLKLETGECERFLQLDAAAQRARVQILRGLADYMRYSWELKPPSVILSVTGSATPFTLRPSYQQAFSRSLLHATRHTNAWVFTGGTNSGIMKLVADGLASQKRAETVIGVTTWGAIHGRTELEAEDSLPRTVLEQFTVALHGLESLADDRIWEDSIREVCSEFGTVVAVTVGKSLVVGTSKCGIKCYVTFRSKEAVERACAKGAFRDHAHRTHFGAARVYAAALEKYEAYEVSEGDSLRGEHTRKVLRCRGDVAMPYIYHGRRQAGEGLVGAPLDRNHSHYLLVDDGTDDEFGRELAIRDELIKFFSFRDDLRTCSDTALTSIIRERPSDAKRSVPVVCLVYGGGVNSLQTVQEHLQAHDPILVVQGTGRAADLLFDWKLLYAECRRVKKQGKAPWVQNERMRTKARAWLLNNTDLCLDENLPQDSKLLELEIGELCKQLDKIVEYPRLHFVNVSPGDDFSERAAILNEAHASILPTMLEAITASSTILQKVKLPLAIRYNDSKMIRQILLDEGFCTKEGCQELSADARPLLFAAFTDQPDVVRLLLDAGFDEQAIDHLILLELHQVAELRQLDSLGGTTAWESQPLPCPPQWEEQRRHEISLSASSMDRDKFKHMTLDQKYVEQLAQVQSEWEQMARDEQMQIARTTTAKVTWDKLQLVPGWSFEVVAKSCRSMVQSSADNTPTESLEVGTRYQLASSKCCCDSKDVELNLVSVEEPFESYTGCVVEPEEAKRTMMTDHGDSSTRTSKLLREVIWEKYLWVIVEDPSVGRVLLRQVSVDEVSGALTINSPGRWVVPLGPDMVSLYESACSAFDPWFIVKELKPGVVWWRHLATSRDKCMFEALRGGLSPMLRVFWATMTGRDGMAELLYARLCSGDKFIAAFLCSWTYRRMHTVAGEQQAKKWDMKAYQQLTDLEVNGRVPPCVFDEYVYFGLKEEQYAFTAKEGELSQFALLSEQQREENAKMRSALVLMGCDEESPKTRVDLAILSENKVYMAQRSTQDFLDSLWENPSSNGKWSDAFFGKVSPKLKWYSNVIGYMGFLLLYFTVYVSMPYRQEQQWHSPKSLPLREATFWVWVISNVNNELRQATDDFDNFRDYRRGSGNLVDMTIIVIFVLALVCRIVSVGVARSARADLEGRQLCSATTACSIYAAFEFLLGVNYIVCVQRLLLMFTRFKNIGVLYEIVGEILRRDVGPFLVILLMFIFSFEVAAHFFAWMLGQRQWGERDGDYASWFRGFGSYFSVLGLNLDEYGELFDMQQGVPEWDQPGSATLSIKMLFSVFFFILVVIILSKSCTAPLVVLFWC